MRIAITGARGQVGRDLAFLMQKENTLSQLLVRDPSAALCEKIKIFDINLKKHDGIAALLQWPDNLKKEAFREAIEVVSILPLASQAKQMPDLEIPNSIHYF